MSGWCTLMACSSSRAFCSIRSFMILLPPEHPPPPRAFCTLLSAWGIGPGLPPPTLLLIDRLRGLSFASLSFCSSAGRGLYGRDALHQSGDDPAGLGVG